MCDVDSNIDINNDASSSSTDIHKKRSTDELGIREDWIDDMAVPTASARHVPCCNLPQSLALPEPVVIQMNGEYNNTYFGTQHKTGLEHAYLVRQSQFKLNIIIDELNEDEVGIHHIIATLVATMGTGQQHLLAETFKSVTSALTRLRSNNNTRDAYGRQEYQLLAKQ